MDTPEAHGTFVLFVEGSRPPSGITRRWSVRARSSTGVVLGEIRWYPGWRCYAFMPVANTIFEQRCLHDIAIFIAGHTRMHKQSRRTSSLQGS